MKNTSGATWWAGAFLLSIVSLILLALFVDRERAITGGVVGAPLDDAWIHFQFARNISQGAGFSYNPGQPTPGSTAPLWTIILAATGFVTTDFLFPALLLSAFFFVAAVLLAYFFSAWITGRLWPGLLAGLAVAFSGRLLWAGLAGMETTAFAAMSLAAIWAYSRYGLRLLPALLFGLAAQLRPEGHALFAFALVDTAAQWFRIGQTDNSFDWRAHFRSAAPPLILYVLIALPYALFSLSTTGRPLPNTFYAKVGSGHLFSLRTLVETAGWHWGDNPASFILALAGLPLLWRRSRLAVVWLLGLPLLTALIIDQTWHHGRYTMPLIPLQMSAAATGLFWISSKLAPVSGSRLTWPRLALIGLSLLLLSGGAWQLPHWATMLGTNTKEIEEIDVAIGRWLAENAPQDALVAVDDIGAITYLAGREIVDMNGLVSPEVWPAVGAADQLQRDQIMTRILSRSGAQLMVAFPLWRWNIATNPDVAQPLYHVQTDTQTIIFQQDAYVYETQWPYLDSANPQHPSSATFADAIDLTGYDLTAQDVLVLVLYWRSRAPVTADYDVFIHIVDSNGRIIAQVDRQPLSGLAATSVWQVGDIIRDPYTVSLPPDIPSGTYGIRLGLFERETGMRLPVAGAGAEEGALLIDSIDVP